MNAGRQLCAYCRTELPADAMVCEACGMSQAVLTAPALKPAPAPPPVPGSALPTPEVTAPTLRPPPDPPAVTAPALLPPPESPALTAPALRPAPEPPPVPAAGAGDPLGAPPAVAAGDPLASPAMIAGDPLAGVEPRPADLATPPPAPADVVAPPAPPAVAAPSAPADASAPPAPADVAAPDDPPASPPPPAKAHPSDATPPGYVTAASLWPVSSRRPSPSTAPASRPEAGAPAAPAESASVVRRSPSAPIEARPPSLAMPAVPPPHAPSAGSAPVAAAPQGAGPVNRARIDRRTAAIVAAIVLLASAATAAVVILTGGSEPSRRVQTGAESQDPPTGAVVEQVSPDPVVTSAAKQPDLDAQVKRLDALMRLSVKGRAAAVNGDIKAATASRAELLRDLKRLDADVSDKQLKAALASFIPAITEALRQNRECGSKCTDAELDKVGRLKQAALRKVNPLLRAHGGDTYRAQEI